MNHQLVLLITPGIDRSSEKSDVIEHQVRAAGLRLSLAGIETAADRLKASTTAGEEPCVVLIGPGVLNPLPVARHIRAAWPSGQILFMPDASQLDKLRRDLRLAPMIGPNWTVVETEDAALPQRLRQAANSTRQRLRLRTTLDRANIQLSAPKTIDSVDYRRMLVSEHYLANLLGQSQDAILSLDTRDRVLYWSAGAERLIKLKVGEVQSALARELPFWSPQLDTSLKKIRSGERQLICETRCSLTAGDIDLEISLSGVRDENGSFIGTSLALRDVSARNQMLEVERTARREAERMSQMKDEFLAILSHELRTPLSAVIGRTQLLQMRYRHDPELLSALDIIGRNAQLQAKLIEDLLDVSSVITGKLHLEIQAVAIDQLIESAIESIRPEAEAKKIILDKTVDPIAGVVHGDQHRLQQVLFNLLTNAVKFTPTGGRVEVMTVRKGSRVEITIKDNGIGIAPDFLLSVFERFGQEDASITRRHGGLGLGLSIARQLVELHGGEIHAFSKGRNRGAAFTVSLPLDVSELAKPKPAARPAVDREDGETSVLRGRHILVVDDVPDTCRLAADVLRSQGAEVMAVDSGSAALEALEHYRPEVIVSDIGMPDMDGYELLRRIRAKGFTREELPAVALTAYASQSDRDKALQAGFHVHTVKPLIVSELIASVARLLAGRNQPGR